jgi:hypothetical protein
LKEYPYRVQETREKIAAERTKETSTHIQKAVKQGIEDANAKLNELVGRFNAQTTPQGSSTAVNLGNGLSTASCPFPAATSISSISSSNVSTSSLLYASQLTEPASTAGSFNSIQAPTIPFPRPHIAQHPTRTIVLAGHFSLTFTENDVPHAPSISFASDLDALNHMWDDTSIHWNGHSALFIRNHPIAITYWKQVYTSKNGKDWKPGQWRILKGRYFEWRVLVGRYRCGTPEEFWATFTTDGKRWNYKAVLKRLAEDRHSQNQRDAEAARMEFGTRFDKVFSYNRNGVQHVKSKDSDIAKQYRALKGEMVIEEEDG